MGKLIDKIKLKWKKMHIEKAPIDYEPTQIAPEPEVRKIDRIIEEYKILQRFLSYPHDNIPDANKRINTQMCMIKSKYGEKAYNRGLEIAEYDKTVNKLNNVMTLQERIQIKGRIINNIDLMEKLEYLRYHPEEAKRKSKSIGYQAVYSKMIEENRSMQKENVYVR